MNKFNFINKKHDTVEPVDIPLNFSVGDVVYLIENDSLAKNNYIHYNPSFYKIKITYQKELTYREPDPLQFLP